jgi:beta-glucosidase/6-phospho-beta-glucosidase/beta-galactosidase
MPAPSTDPASTVPRGPGGILPEGFRFGVATAGFQVEGGFNGPGEPANNWRTWEQVGRVEPSGNAVGFWDHPDEALDRAAAMGCDSFRLGVEWARVEPAEGVVDDTALARYGAMVDGCTERGMEPLVTLHHFTHPGWLGEELWLRPDSPERYLAWVETALSVLAPKVRLWVTVNEINAVVLGSWLLGMFPPGRMLSFGDAVVATDNLLTAHVLGYEAIHRARPDAEVTTNNASVSVYDSDRLLTDILCSRSLGVARGDLDAWLGERRAEHDAAVPPPNPAERLLRRFAAAASGYGPPLPGTGHRRSPGRAADAVYASPHERTLDAVGFDYYDPLATRHFRAPGHRTAGGRAWLPVRELWDDVPDPPGLASWLGAQQAATPAVPLWVVENGLCNRVRSGHAIPRLDGWDRPRYLREHLAAVVAAVDAGVPVTGYWHWSLVDNYEWGSYEPRFGLHGIDRHRSGHGMRWLETDALGDDSAGAYRDIIAGLRAGDRGVLTAG